MSAKDGWSDENARGLGYAAVGAWVDAIDAFTAAEDAVASRADLASHEARALVLNNLAQACFRGGRVEDAIRHAQRACSLRAALLGEDAIAVARARSDLAVMLGSAGRAGEGLALIGRSIASIELNAGDEDLRLSDVLENAARLAIAAGAPSTAEPYLLRLHALLAVHDLPTYAADVLLARVSSYRRHSANAIPLMTVVAAERVAEQVAVHIAEHAPVGVDAAPDEVLDDQPLFDAVLVTDALLRNTPARSRVIYETPVRIVAIAEPTVVPVHTVAEPMLATAPEMSLDLDIVDLPIRHRGDDIFGNTRIDLVESAATTAVAVTANNSLGFTIEYGTPTEPSAQELADMIVPPPTSTHIPTPDESVLAVMSRMSPRGSPVVMPSPPRGQKAISTVSEVASQSDAVRVNDTTEPKLTLHHSDDLARERRPKRPSLRFLWPRG